jgi:hypothetical protein
MGSRYGATARKKTMMVISTAVVWIATGLWHGTGINYMVWGLYWGVIIIFSELFSEQIERLSSFLHINTAAPAWKVVQMVRTFLIFTIGKMISAQSTLRDVRMILGGVISSTHLNDFRVLGNIESNRLFYYIILTGSLAVFVVSCLQERGVEIRKSIAKWPAVPRWFFYSFALFVVSLIGIYGTGYETSTFAYQFF